MKATIYNRFDQLASWTSESLGNPVAFLIALMLILTWALCGPIVGFNDSWQLLVNTGTTIATFLMVFLIQNSENRSTRKLCDLLEQSAQENLHLQDRLDRIELLLMDYKANQKNVLRG